MEAANGSGWLVKRALGEAVESANGPGGPVECALDEATETTNGRAVWSSSTPEITEAVPTEACGTNGTRGVRRCNDLEDTRETSMDSMEDMASKANYSMNIATPPWQQNVQTVRVNKKQDMQYA